MQWTRNSSVCTVHERGAAAAAGWLAWRGNEYFSLILQTKWACREGMMNDSDSQSSDQYFAGKKIILVSEKHPLRAG